MTSRTSHTPTTQRVPSHVLAIEELVVQVEAKRLFFVSKLARAAAEIVAHSLAEVAQAETDLMPTSLTAFVKLMSTLSRGEVRAARGRVMRIHALRFLAVATRLLEDEATALSGRGGRKGSDDSRRRARLGAKI